MSPRKHEFSKSVAVASRFANSRGQQQAATSVVMGMLAFFVALALTACNTNTSQSAQRAVPSDPCAIVLLPPAGGTNTDWQVEKIQRQVREDSNPAARLERLGWLYVSRARTKHDPGYYTLAEHAAACIEKGDTDSTAALLLRGHVRQNQHRFQEAERIARRLVAQRESPFDHGLLGDALMEQGRLDEAAASYQKMVDMRPGLESYSRGAHLRWLHGDLEGATELMRLAARAGGPRNAEPTAWAYTRLAHYELHSGAFERSLQAARAALELQPGYARALLAEARVFLAKGEPLTALEPLSQAASRNPLPEYQWLLADVLRAVGQIDEATRVESEIERQGAIEDPRTFSLYLATRSREAVTAVRLAERELASRSDIFTYDALAWSLYAVGETERARQAMKNALSAGTQDARLFLHAALISAAAGEAGEAARFRKMAQSLRHLLLPSELEWLNTPPRPPAQRVSSS